MWTHRVTLLTDTLTDSQYRIIPDIIVVVVGIHASHAHLAGCRESLLKEIYENPRNCRRAAHSKWKSAHAGCSKVEPKIFAPPQTPFPGAQDGQNLISRRWSLPSPTDPVWWRSMHAISSCHGNRPTNKQPQTHRQDRLQHTAPQLACSVTVRCCRACVLIFVLAVGEL